MLLSWVSRRSRVAPAWLNRLPDSPRERLSEDQPRFTAQHWHRIEETAWMHEETSSKLTKKSGFFELLLLDTILEHNNHLIIHKQEAIFQLSKLLRSHV